MAEENKLANLFSGFAQNMCKAVTLVLREELQGTLSCGCYYIIATRVFLVAIIFYY